eukprot:scaffold27824_cov17-Tisochrysis_lutea.AAC.2
MFLMCTYASSQQAHTAISSKQARLSTYHLNLTTIASKHKQLAVIYARLCRCSKWKPLTEV